MLAAVGQWARLGLALGQFQKKETAKKQRQQQQQQSSNTTSSCTS
jgi:hypothetical protein